ncbi:MAG: potassium transporter TrkG [Ignisphaera sp.]
MGEDSIGIKIKTVVFSISILVSTVMFIAFAIGLLFLIFSIYTENKEEIEASSKFVIATITVLVPSIGIAISLRGYEVTEILEAIIVVMLSWLIIPALNAFIYCYVIGLDYVDAFFESISGFTGTGLTIISKPEELPYTVLIWRASTQWIGELGVIVFSAALLPYIHRVLSRVYIAERGVKLSPTILATTRRLVSIYLLLTSSTVVMLILSGMSFLDAVAHSMTAIATGGMSTNSESIGFWYRLRGSIILITSSIAMVLGALNFSDLYNLVRGNIKKFLKSIEVKWFAYLLITLCTLTTVILFSSLGANYDAMGIAIYHVISGFTTTGFQVDDIGRYPDALKFVLILAMIIGGATFSTAGGIKIRRIVIALKAAIWSSAKPFLPEKVYLVRRINDEIVEEEDIESVYAYILIYIITATILSISLYLILNMYTGYSWSKNYNYIDTFFETISALSCVGLSTGITSINIPLAAKLILITTMYLGRLEFAPIYLVIGYWYKKKVTL